MTEFPVIARDTLGADGTVLTLLLTVFAIGVGVGSMLARGCCMARCRPASCRSPRWASRCSAGTSPRPPPRARHHRDGAGRADLVRRLADDRRSVPAGGVRRRVLGAALRHHPGHSGAVRAVAHDRRQQHHERAVHGGGRRGRRRHGRAGLRAPAVLHVAAVANLSVAVWIVRILPHEVYRALLRWYFHRFHRAAGPAARRTTGQRATAW